MGADALMLRKIAVNMARSPKPRIEQNA